MASFFFSSKKSKHPGELVKQTRDALTAMEKSKGSAKASDKASEQVTQNLAAMKCILLGEPGAEPNAEAASALANEIYAMDLIPLFVQHLSEFEFEAKKDVVAIINCLLRRQVGAKFPTVDYICKNTQVLDDLITGYNSDFFNF